MTGAATIEVWSGGDCAGPPGYGYGGWSWLIVQGAEVRGFVGGERHSSGMKMKLRGMIEALKAAAGQPNLALRLDPGDLALAKLGADWKARAAAGWTTADGEPIEEPALWGEAARLLAARVGAVRFTAPGPPHARSFIGAWTDFARDRCRDKGAFTAAIPKPNLATFLAKRAQA